MGATAAALMGAYAVSSTFPTHAGSVGHEVAAKYSVYDLPIGKKFPRVMPCFIEVAKGSRNKYEWDEHVGFLRLDRVLHSSCSIFSLSLSLSRIVTPYTHTYRRCFLSS